MDLCEIRKQSSEQFPRYHPGTATWTHGQTAGQAADNIHRPTDHFWPTDIRDG